MAEQPRPRAVRAPRKQATRTRRNESARPARERSSTAAEPGRRPRSLREPRPREHRPSGPGRDRPGDRSRGRSGGRSSSTNRSTGRTGAPRSRPRTTVKRRKGYKAPLRIPLAAAPRRLRTVLVIVAVALSLCGGRLLQLQGFDSASYAAASTDALTRNLPLLASRGSITDRNGVVMAATEPAVAVTADPSLTRLQPDRFAAVLAKHLGQAATRFLPLLTNVDKAGKPVRFVYLKKKVPAITYTRLAKELAEQDLYGVFRESDPIRTYPGQAVAGNLLGFLDVKGAGVAGLESELNTQLAGVPGKESYESSPNGSRIPLGSSTITPAQNGLDYTTTLDSELQFFAERRIAAAVASTRAKWGFAITMDVKTGEILALAQAPTVDASNPGKARPENRGIRAVNENYEPGSVQKVLTSAALLDSGTATPDTRLIVPKTLKSGPTSIRDFIGHDTDHLLMRGVIAESSNIGTALLSRQMPKAKLAAYLKKFGLGTPTGIELPREAPGILPGPQMKDLTRDRVAFGQALAVTGIQEISAIAGIVNDGIYHPPTVLKSASRSDGTPVALPDKPSRKIISSKASAGVRDMMRAVVDHGSRTIKLDDWTSGGKTGTAQRADPKCGCYKGYTTSFIGFAPLKDPRIITYVVLDNPRKGDTGSRTAGPVYQDIMKVALPRYAVAPSTKVPEPKPITW